MRVEMQALVSWHQNCSAWLRCDPKEQVIVLKRERHELVRANRCLEAEVSRLEGELERERLASWTAEHNFGLVKVERDQLEQEVDWSKNKEVDVAMESMKRVYRTQLHAVSDELLSLQISSKQETQRVQNENHALTTCLDAAREELSRVSKQLACADPTSDLQSKQQRLYDLEQEMLQSPKSERKRFKEKVKVLDKEVASLRAELATRQHTINQSEELQLRVVELETQLSQSGICDKLLQADRAFAAGVCVGCSVRV